MKHHKQVGKQLTSAQQQLVIDHMSYGANLAKRILNRSQRKGISLEDLNQEAYLALCLAALRFDPGLGVTFATFAFDICRKRIQVAIDHEGDSFFCDDQEEQLRVIDDSDEQQEVHFRVDLLMKKLNKKEREVISRAYGMEGDPQGFHQIAEEMNMNWFRIKQIYEKAVTKMEFGEN